jgi:hypothetical protein
LIDVSQNRHILGLLQSTSSELIQKRIDRIDSELAFFDG